MRTLLLCAIALLTPSLAFADAKIMNPGEAYGQLVILSADDVQNNSPKYQALTALSVPVFAALPTDMSVVAGAITLKQQTLLSHVQLKSRARHTPNLDISDLEGGLQNPLLSPFADGAWIHMLLGTDGSILIEPSDEQKANDYYNQKKTPPFPLQADLSRKEIAPSEQLSSPDFITVGSKAANYGELMKALNTADRTVVKPGFGIPFYYYQEFIDNNPKIKAAIASLLRDPLMNKVAKISYREQKLKALQDMMRAKDAVMNEQLVTDLIARFDTLQSKGSPRKLKLRSSTNSEDLPNFNGAGLYDSFGYNPRKKDGSQKSDADKRKDLKQTLQSVWASVWNLRAFDERTYFRIPHADVKMGIQVNPAYPDEGADGVVVSRNIAHDARFPSPEGVYIEVQRGSEYSVTNPVAGVKPQKVLVLYAPDAPLNTALYQIQVLQNSNIADDGKTILPQDNPLPVLQETEIKDLAYQVMKAHAHFKPIFGADKGDFGLDMEFKVDSEDTGSRQVYLKQARPYID